MCYATECVLFAFDFVACCRGFLFEERGGTDLYVSHILCSRIFFPTTRFFLRPILERRLIYSIRLIAHTVLETNHLNFVCLLLSHKFPYVTSKLAEFLQRNWTSEEMKSAVEALRIQVRKEATQKVTDLTPSGDVLSMHPPQTYPAYIPFHIIDRLLRMLLTVSLMPPQLPRNLPRCKFDRNCAYWSLY